MSSVFLIIWVTMILILLGMNQSRTGKWKRVPHHLMNERDFGLYVVYITVVCWIFSRLMSSIPSTASVILCLALIYVPLVWVRPHFRLYYSNEDAAVFRQELPAVSSSSTSSKSSYQTTVMTLYADERQTQPIGRFFSSAELFDDASRQGLHQINQHVLYVLDGSHPDFP